MPTLQPFKLIQCGAQACTVSQKNPQAELQAFPGRHDESLPRVVGGALVVIAPVPTSGQVNAVSFTCLLPHPSLPFVHCSVSQELHFPVSLCSGFLVGLANGKN